MIVEKFNHKQLPPLHLLARRPRVCILAHKFFQANYITILQHPNDVISHIRPFSKNHSHYPNLGAWQERATLVDETIRKENPNTLLFRLAGELFFRVHLLQFLWGRIRNFKLMSPFKTMTPPTIGNQRVLTMGIQGLYSQLPHASFDFYPQL